MTQTLWCIRSGALFLTIRERTLLELYALREKTTSSTEHSTRTQEMRWSPTWLKSQWRKTSKTSCLRIWWTFSGLTPPKIRSVRISGASICTTSTCTWGSALTRSVPRTSLQRARATSGSSASTSMTLSVTCRSHGSTFHSICLATIYRASSTQFKRMLSSLCSPIAAKTWHNQKTRSMVKWRMRNRNKSRKTNWHMIMSSVKTSSLRQLMSRPSKVTSSAWFHSGSTLVQWSALTTVSSRSLDQRLFHLTLRTAKLTRSNTWWPGATVRSSASSRRKMPVINNSKILLCAL